MWIIELLDTEIKFSHDNTILYKEPGIALVRKNNVEFGTRALNAWRLLPANTQSHFWQRIDQSPVEPSGLGIATQADLLYRQLLESIAAAKLPSHESVLIVVPSDISPDQLALLFGIAKPDVYKSSASDTYIVFGEAKVSDVSPESVPSVCHICMNSS